MIIMPNKKKYVHFRSPNRPLFYRTTLTFLLSFPSSYFHCINYGNQPTECIDVAIKYHFLASSLV